MGMADVWLGAKRLVKRAFFAPGSVRRSRVGPYSGIAFEMCPQILRTRMSIFYRAYEPEVTALLASTIRPGMVVYDVGAHVGIHALYAAKLLAHSGAVFAFEPWPDNLAVLRRHVAHNPRLANRLRPIGACVGASGGGASMVGGEGDGQHRLAGPDENGEVTAAMVSLDEFAEAHPPGPALILVDVEGEELAVLAGAERVLRSTRPQLVLEHHGTERRAALTEWLTQRSYRVSDLGDRHLHAV
jgi:FkbM family methyltransferase